MRQIKMCYMPKHDITDMAVYTSVSNQPTRLRTCQPGLLVILYFLLLRTALLYRPVVCAERRERQIVAEEIA